MAIVNITTKEEFQKEVLDSDKPVIVDFWAPWCGPCKMLGPAYEALSNESDDTKFVKINVDEAEDLAAENDIMGIPTIKGYNNGQEVQKKVGALNKAQLKEFVDSVKIS